MKYPILIPTDCRQIEFLDFWKKRYDYNGLADILNIISQDRFTADDIRTLFVWKNGMKLSGMKSHSLECKIISKLEKINLFKSQKEFSIDNYLEEFRNVSFVWKIFLLHTIRPNDYPIYDQNVHRAFAMINGDLYDKITSSMSDKQKSNFYFKDYVPFFQAVDRHQRIDFDKAFFAFGQFLNTGNYDGFF